MRALALLLWLLLLTTWAQAQSFQLLDGSRYAPAPEQPLDFQAADPFFELRQNFRSHKSTTWHSKNQAIDHWFVLKLPEPLLSADRVIIKINNDRVTLDQVWSNPHPREARLTANHISLIFDQAEQEFFLHIRSQEPASFQIIAMDLDHYWTHQRAEHLWQGLIFGAFTVLMVLLIGFAWSHRQWLLVLAALYTLVWALFFLATWLPWHQQEPDTSYLLAFNLVLLCHQLLIFKVASPILQPWQKRTILGTMLAALLWYQAGLSLGGILADLPLLQVQSALVILWLLIKLFSFSVPGYHGLLQSAVFIFIMTILLNFDQQGMALIQPHLNWLYPLLCIAHLIFLYFSIFALAGPSKQNQVANSNHSSPPLSPLLHNLKKELQDQAQMIYGMTELLADLPQTDSRSDQLDRLKLAALKIIDINVQLTALTQKQRGERFEQFDLLQLIEQCIERNRIRQELHQHSIRLNVQSLMRSARVGDHKTLAAILNILLSQAMSRETQGEPIDLSIFEQGGAAVQISVRSTGFPAQISVQDIMPSSTQPPALGLPLAQHLAKQIHAQLNLRSEGKAQTLMLNLPLQALLQTKEQSQPLIPVNHQHCLIIDLDPYLTLYLQQLLESEGHKVDVCRPTNNPCSQILEAQKHHGYDLIFIGHDAQQNGIHLAQQIHLLSLWQPIKAVILMAANPLKPEQQQICSDICQSVILKPLFYLSLKKELNRLATNIYPEQIEQD